MIIWLSESNVNSKCTKDIECPGTVCAENDDECLYAKSTCTDYRGQLRCLCPEDYRIIRSRVDCIWRTKAKFGGDCEQDLDCKRATKLAVCGSGGTCECPEDMVLRGSECQYSGYYMISKSYLTWLLDSGHAHLV